MAGKVTTSKLFHVEGIDAAFTSETEAAKAAILVLLGVWDCPSRQQAMIGLDENLDEIQIQLGVLREPKNQTRKLA